MSQNNPSSSPPAKASSYKVLPTTPPNNNSSTSSGAQTRSRTTIRPLPGSSGGGSVGHHHPNNNNSPSSTSGGRPSLPVLPSQDNLGAHTHRLVSTVKTSLDYDQFAQIITTSPSLLSALHSQRLLTSSEVDEMASALYQLASALSTLCFMNKVLIGIEFERGTDTSTTPTGSGLVIMRGNTIATKIMDNVVKSEGVNYLKSILLEPMKKVLLDEALDLEIDPSKFEASSRMESETDLPSLEDTNFEGKPNHEIRVEENLENLNLFCRYFLDRMLSREALDTMPFNIRYICKIIYEMCRDKYRVENAETLIASFVFLRLFNPTIVYPESREILPTEVKIHSKQRRNLVLISKVVQQIANGFEFGAKETFMIPLNPLINEYIEKAKKFLVECATLDCEKKLEAMEKQVPEKVKSKVISNDDQLIQDAMNVQMLIKAHEKTILEKNNQNCKDLINVLSRLPKIEEAIKTEMLQHSSSSNNNSSHSLTSSSVTSKEDKKYQDSERYLELLEKAKQEDVRDLEAMNVLTCRHTDPQGRPVVIFSEEKIRKEDLDRTLLYMIAKLDKVVENDYVMIWCVSNSTSQARPGFSWMLNVYRTITRKYKKNLKSLYILHPTMMIKVIMKCFSPFVSEKFWKKLHLVDSIQDIYKDIPEETLPLPPTTIAYDIMQNNIKSNQYALFGAPLEDIMTNRKDCIGCLVPTPIKNCMDFMREHHADTRGIFRISGNQATVNQLKILLNHGTNVDLHHVDCHVLSSLIKLFFRELPDPLFKYSMYDEIIKSVKEAGSSTSTIIESLKTIIAKLPQYHLELAKELFSLLYYLQTLSEENMMNAHNLAIVFGPNIIRSNSPNPLLALQDNGPLTYATEIMIGYYDQLFTSSPSGNDNARPVSRNHRPQALDAGDLEQLKNLNFDQQ
ncbi:hypothetical protein C9374_009801 [Naegleria lovaniensis]|uniref:Uncharacterized protein n=1 Tax=Naegleria lovaniensis TaxID=51637 RepID=A0AA88GZ27_NAELO|nr:uncharacterized protein C9374_009801 [Naegleria lovaniensis]KAG2393224.1 hypothetical protein C9374_009801 [Naegleria lovaniensis]